MKSLLNQALRLGVDLGRTGQAALALLGVTVLFVSFVLVPLQSRNRALEASLERHARQAAPAAGQPALGKLDTLYAYLEKSEAPTDSMSKCSATATAKRHSLDSESIHFSQNASSLPK